MTSGQGQKLSRLIEFSAPQNKLGAGAPPQITTPAA
mgnify:CR=1 FL=1